MSSKQAANRPRPQAERHVQVVRDSAGRQWVEKRAGPEAEHEALRWCLRNHHLITCGLDLPGAACSAGLEHDGDDLVLRLPWLPGLSLAKGLLRAGSPHPAPALAQAVALGAARLLAALETQGIAHSAVNARHVVWDPRAQAVSLLDFGQARFVRCVAITGGTPADNA